ncbi:(2Fe-2S)-binding protein [Rhizobiales bacterium]|uniref:(2Fe-2S)-binding protein n=1 Tax=Hongsoonwoonella zoysiae TaxID=2821844 RepID=UPI00156016D0|nr:(2Fe-2S)-binding protein [Hongsoonwoonella zoysiae]
MIVCSCNVLSDKELREAASRLRNAPGGGVVTPGAVFRALGHRPRCGGCFSAVVPIIHEAQPRQGDSFEETKETETAK